MSPARASRKTDTSKLRAGFVQAWVELRADDPEAVSALAVARARLPEGQGLSGLRRLRVFELSGPLPGGPAVAELLHRSTWFYNPHKERCMVRAEARGPTPALGGDQAVLVVERGGERRPAAERWWFHETGQRIEVREAVAWLLRYAPGQDARARAAELAVLQDRHRGLLCHPAAQAHALAAADEIPLPWIGAGAADEGKEGNG